MHFQVNCQSQLFVNSNVKPFLISKDASLAYLVTNVNGGMNVKVNDNLGIICHLNYQSNDLKIIDYQTYGISAGILYKFKDNQNIEFSLQANQNSNFDNLSNQLNIILHNYIPLNPYLSFDILFGFSVHSGYEVFSDFGLGFIYNIEYISNE